MGRIALKVRMRSSPEALAELREWTRLFLNPGYPSEGTKGCGE